MRLQNLLHMSIVFVFILLTYGCGKSVLDGGGEAPEFDSVPYIFDKKKTDTTLVAKNSVSWRFSGIRTDFEYYSLKGNDSKSDTDCECHYIEEGYEGCWFTLKKVSDTKLRIAVKENLTGKKRKFSFAIQNLDAFREITVEQKAE